MIIYIFLKNPERKKPTERWERVDVYDGDIFNAKLCRPYLPDFHNGGASLVRPLVAGSRYYILTFPPPADILLSRANSGKLQQIYNPFVSLQLATFSPHRT